MMHETDRFEAVGVDGTLYVVIERRETQVATSLGGDTTKVQGPFDYVLSDGRDLSPVDHKMFKIVLTDEIIRKV